MFYEDVFRALQDHKVRYLVIGGAAVNLHGVPRMTADLDITIELSQENVDALTGALASSGMKPPLPVDPRGLADPEQRQQWRDEKKLAALTFLGSGSEATYREVDVVLQPPLDFEQMYSARTQLDVDDITVDLVSLGHLIEIKRGMGREQDIADVKALEKVEADERGRLDKDEPDE